MATPNINRADRLPRTEMATGGRLVSCRAKMNRTTHIWTNSDCDGAHFFTRTFFRAAGNTSAVLSPVSSCRASVICCENILDRLRFMTDLALGTGFLLQPSHGEIAYGEIDEV